MGGISPNQAAAAEPCPNEARRLEQGPLTLALPDCRAYELTNPGGLLYQDTDSDWTVAAGGRSSISGDAVTYYTIFPAPDAASSGYFYLATRGAGGWSLQNVGVQSAPEASFHDACEPRLYFSSDFSQNIDEEGWAFPEGGAPRCKRPQDVIVAGEPFPYRNVFLHDMETGGYQLINVTPEGVAPANAKFQDASDDFSRILFSAEAMLTPDSPSGRNLFMWEKGNLRLIPHLPNGTPVAGELVENGGYLPKAGGSSVPSSGLAPITGAVSADGTQVFFYSGTNLYLRQNADKPQSDVSGGACTQPALACTVQVDLSQGPGASGGGNFWRATDDAATAFFTADSRLTADATSVTGKADLYEYDVESGDLTDLTISAGEPADVRGISGMGGDGSYLYFVANGVLAPGATPGTCRGSTKSGQTCNLYVAHQGSIDFIASLSRTDRNTWQEAASTSTLPRLKQPDVWANISSSGRFFAFMSVQSLTGYDNRDAKSGDLNRQIFFYDAAANEGSGQLSCASCDPTGTRRLESAMALPFGGKWSTPSYGNAARWKINAVHNDGSIFFDTEDPLVPEDENGFHDVYQYKDGIHRLLSTGTFAGRSRFIDASPDGSDVFIRTPQTLVPSDTDNENVSLYDARVDGGFIEPPAPPPCEGESCREAVPPAPELLLPGSASFYSARKSMMRPQSGRRQCRRDKKHRGAKRCVRKKQQRGTKQKSRDRKRGVAR